MLCFCRYHMFLSLKKDLMNGRYCLALHLPINELYVQCISIRAYRCRYNK